MTQAIASPWPEKCQGAISLAFDDGLTSQLEVAIPMLNEYNLKGTFYINPRGDDWQERLAPWREVALSGHEVGNHTINHPCSRNFSFTNDPKGRLETMTLADVEEEIVEASRRLRLLIPEQEDFTFCYPCYLDYVGEGLTRQSYVPVVAKYFPAARGGGEIANHPLLADLHYLWSWTAERMSGAELVGLTERAVSQERWGILTFHGIQQGHLPVSEFDFRELCVFLARNRDRIWVAPVVTVARCIIEWRTKQTR